MNDKPNVLIVDDKPENLVALEVVLRELDLNIVKASNGNEALKATLHHDFALALLDIQMPEMDGYELASILREEEKTSRLPFIFISAVYTSNLNVFKGYEQGAFSFITKPFQKEILINKVNFFIEKYQQEAALFALNEELKNSNKELEAFSYSVSHDLRAPLRALSGYVETLREDYGTKLDADANNVINKIDNKTIQMGMLIDDLLAFSQLGRRDLRKTLVDVNDLVERLMNDVPDSVKERSEVVIGHLHKVTADYSLLRQVLFNLISNAFKYSSKKEKPVIEISSEEKNGQIIFSVKDNGVGFDMKYADKLFGVFQRLHSQEQFEGTGAGLAIAHRIITKHHGKIWAEGKVNQGAVFYFSLPQYN